MEKSLVTALRAAALTSLALPFSLAAFGAALTGGGPSPVVIAPVLLTVTAAAVVCWARAIERLRRQRPPDDDDPWRRQPPDGDPRSPEGGPGGVPIDWVAFERDFAAYAQAHPARADRVLARHG